jgi:hypothetical protein
MPKFYTKAGWLTDYALACGYVHRQTRTDGGDVILERLSSGAYYVASWQGGAQHRDAYHHTIGGARKSFAEFLARPLTRRFENAQDVRRFVTQ